MKKLYPLLLLISTLFSSLIADTTPLVTNVPNRNTISLDGKWHYIVDPYQNGYYDYRRKPHDDRMNPGSGAYFTCTKPANESERIEYSFEDSPTMHVPGGWGTQIPELTWYEGTLWYQKDFLLSKKENKKYFIHFGAVNYEAHVWINGVKMGTHIGGFTPFNFDATSALKDGQNFVVVMVDNTRNESAVPTVATDWWNHGGITRSVRLIELPKTFIRDFEVRLSKDGNLIEGFAQLSENVQNDITLTIPECDFKWSGKTDQNGKVVFSQKAPDLTRWDTSNPKLYDVIITSKNDTLKDKIGFRTIEVKGQEILLNGKKIFLKGICMHEENPLDGSRNYSLSHARMMFDWVEDLEANFVRLAHYPHNENMPRLADERGILLWEEIPVYWTIDWDNKATLDNAKNQLKEVITRDRNRASVIIWSMANETPVSEKRNAFLGELVSTARSLDNSRLISAAMEVKTIDGVKHMDDPFGKLTDITSFNQYHGWYGGDRDQLPHLKWEIAYGKPVIVSEWGAGALYGKHGTKDTMWSEENQAHLYEKTLEGIFNIPGLSGMTPWIIADFRSPRRPLPNIQDMWNRKGIISEGGHKKQAFFILRDFYRSPETNPER